MSHRKAPVPSKKTFACTLQIIVKVVCDEMHEDRSKRPAAADAAATTAAAERQKVAAEVVGEPDSQSATD